MKISEMIQREDFYEINSQTLQNYFGSNCSDYTKLYIYPKLNAIVTRKPSNQVINYLLTEYSVNSVVKRILAYCYVRLCLQSKGLMASRTIKVNGRIRNDTLIYPCNKKYRIFHFDDNKVSVVIKHGFDTTDLMHEIEYRTRNEIPSFVPQIENSLDQGYTERIIKGKPIVRIPCAKDLEKYKQKAYDEFRRVYASSDYTINCNEYVQTLIEHIKKQALIKYTTRDLLNSLIENLKDIASHNGQIVLTFSHGDLQAGNVWVSDDEQKIYIIDWESWGIRSVWYDYATLFEHLRPGDIRAFLNCGRRREEKALVLLEDIVFQLNELESLPKSFGIEKFNSYVGILNSWLQEG